MDRREALRLLATGAAFQLAPRTLFAVLREARALVNTEAAPRTLDSHQNATVRAIAELVLPRTETPGATDVGASAFVDLILTEWYDEEERNTFLDGLADIDSHSQSLFAKAFVDGSVLQQAEILRALGEKMTEEADGVRDNARQARGSSPKLDKNFYYMLRRLTLTAYYTSEAGATKELDFQIIPDHYDGCAETHAGKEAPESQ